MAFNCGNTTGKTADKSILFTRIPSKPDSVRVEWLTKLHREDIDPKKFEPGKYDVLCSVHFEDDCFEIDGPSRYMEGIIKRKFKKTMTIVPTIFYHTRPVRVRQHTEHRIAEKAKHTVSLDSA